MCIKALIFLINISGLSWDCFLFLFVLIILLNDAYEINHMWTVDMKSNEEWSSHLKSWIFSGSCFIWFNYFIVSYNSDGRNHVITRDMFRNENRSNWKINGKPSTMKEVNVLKWNFWCHWVFELFLHLSLS